MKLFKNFSKSKKTDDHVLSNLTVDQDHLQDINERLYKQNLELAVKNKTLSLLSKLYQISILTLEPKSLTEKVNEVVRAEFEFDSVSSFLYDDKKDALTLLDIAESERFKSVRQKYSLSLEGFPINYASKIPFLQKVLKNKTSSYTYDLNEVFSGMLDHASVTKFSEETHTKTLLMYPLVIQNEVIGAFSMTFNRKYEDMNDFEKAATESVVNVAATALDKAMLYQEVNVANEKLKSLDKLKTEFLSLASHQLRSPLTAIKGYTSMLLEGSFGEVGEKQREAIDRVFQSVQHLSKIVEDLLSVTKIEQGGMQYQMSSFDFEKVAREITEDLSVTAKKKGVEMTFAADSKSGYTVNGDMEKIRQVVLNLVDNSIKYTPAGSVHVGLSKDEQKKKILLSISDTGIGMTEETIESLFQKFSRGNGVKVNMSGSGLGLYLAKQIVEAHKGRMWIESPGLNKGSTFYVELTAI